MAEMSGKKLGRNRRIGWGLADQAVSSVTNFALGVVVARSTTSRGFGSFAIAFAVYVVLLGISRAVHCEPLSIRFSGSDPKQWRHGTAQATGAVLCLGTAAGLGSIGIGLLIGGVVGPSLVSVGIMLPGLLLQDCWRYAFFAAQKPHLAFWNDATWGLIQLLIFVWLVQVAEPEASLLLGGWGLAAGVAAIQGALQAGLRPAPSQFPHWIATQRDLFVPLVAEFAQRTLVLSGPVFVAGAMRGLGGAGAFRAAQVLYGPQRALTAGLSMLALPEAARAKPESVTSGLFVLSCITAAPFAVSGIILATLPDWAGEALLGASWEGARTVILPVGLGLAGLGAGHGPSVGLRAFAAARSSLRVQTISTTIMIPSFVLGGWFAGAVGIALAFAISGWLSVPLWWRAYFREYRARCKEVQLLVETAKSC